MLLFRQRSLFVLNVIYFGNSFSFISLQKWGIHPCDELCRKHRRHVYGERTWCCTGHSYDAKCCGGYVQPGWRWVFSCQKGTYSWKQLLQILYGIDYILVSVRKAPLQRRAAPPKPNYYSALTANRWECRVCILGYFSRKLNCLRYMPMMKFYNHEITVNRERYFHLFECCEQPGFVTPYLSFAWKITLQATKKGYQLGHDTLLSG